MCGWRKLPYISSLAHLEMRSVFLSLGSSPVTCITNRIGHKSGCTSFWVQVLRNSRFYFLPSRTGSLREEADYLETVMLWRKLQIPQVLKSELYVERERERETVGTEGPDMWVKKPSWKVNHVQSQMSIPTEPFLKPSPTKLWTK